MRPTPELGNDLTRGSHLFPTSESPGEAPADSEVQLSRKLPGSRRLTKWYVPILFVPPAAVRTAAGVWCLLRRAPSRQLNPFPHVGWLRKQQDVPRPSRCEGQLGPRVAAHLPQEATDRLRGKMRLGEGTDTDTDTQGAETVAFTLKLLRTDLPPFPPRSQPTSTPEPVSHRGGQAPFRGGGTSGRIAPPSRRVPQGQRLIS